MRNILEKYGVWEYVTFIGGFLVFSKIIYSYLTDTLEYTSLNGFAFLISVLLMSMPMTIVTIGKKIATKFYTNE